MISKIRESGADISSSERDMGNIIDIYNSLVTKKELDIVRTKSIQIKYPVLSPHQYSSVLKEIGITELNYGGSLISDSTNVVTSLIPDIVDILASCVIFKNQKYTKYDDRLYDTVSTNIVDFAF